MTIAYLHLIRLHPTITPTSFLTLIHQHALSYHYIPLITSLTHHWVVHPTTTDKSALNQPWDVLVILQASPSSSSSVPPESTSHAHAQIPTSLSPFISTTYTLPLAIPSALLTSFPARNASIRAVQMPHFDRARLQQIQQKVINRVENKGHLEANPELLAFAGRMMSGEEVERGGAGPVTMLNLLRFNEGEPGRESYRRYGREFAQGVGSRRGGDAKIVGRVIGGGDEGRWDEVAVVHYPNIVAFCDMASAEDYQAANARWRLPALKDTILLCTTEFSPETDGGLSKL